VTSQAAQVLAIPGRRCAGPRPPAPPVPGAGTQAGAGDDHRAEVGRRRGGSALVL